MASPYFKSRKAFDFKADRYALGNILGIRSGYEDNHFLLKVYSLEESWYEDYYSYHLKHYQSKSTGNKERDFFAHIWHIISDRITYFQSRDPFSPKHPLYLSNIEKLKSFQSFLSPKDKWNVEFQLKIGDFFMLPFFLFQIAFLRSVWVFYTPEQNVFFWCYKILQYIQRSPI